MRRFRWWLVFVVLLAFGLRLYAIDRQDIWGDEAFSIWLSRQPLPQVVAGGADTHPPLYPFLLYLWLPLAGSSSLATRFLSACIGVLTVPLVYLLGHRALGRATGGLAALLAAVSPILIYYSQDTRMYGLATLLAAASLYWAMRVLVGRDAILPYLLTTLAAVYTHYYAFFVVLAENLVLLPTLVRQRHGPALRRWLAVQAALALAYVPWIVVQSRFLGGKANARFDEWDLSTALRLASETARAFGAGLALPTAPSWVIAGLFLAAVAIGLVALFPLSWGRGQGRGKSAPGGKLPPPPQPSSLRGMAPESWLIVACLFVPLFLAWAVNPLMPFFYPRYLLLSAPAFYLLAAWGAVSLARRWPPLAVAGALLLLAGSASGLHGYYTDETLVKGRYGQMMAYVEAHTQPGDGLLLANQLQRPIFEYYQPAGIDAYFFPSYDYPLEDPRTAADLEAIAAEHPRLWLVRFGNPAEYDPDGALTRWLATHGSKAYFGGWGDADLSLYVMTPAGATETIQHPLRADLGDQVRLLGYTLSAEQVAPAGTLLLTLYWQARAPMELRYTIFTHLLDAGNRVVAQMDSEPQGGGLPTDRWTVGQIVPDNYALTVDADAAPGPHLLEVGMYYLPTLDRLPVRDPDTGAPLGDRVLLGPIEVVAP